MGNDIDISPPKYFGLFHSYVQFFIWFKYYTCSYTQLQSNMLRYPRFWLLDEHFHSIYIFWYITIVIDNDNRHKTLDKHIVIIHNVWLFKKYSMKGRQYSVFIFWTCARLICTYIYDWLSSCWKISRYIHSCFLSRRLNYNYVKCNDREQNGEFEYIWPKPWPMMTAMYQNNDVSYVSTEETWSIVWIWPNTTYVIALSQSLFRHRAILYRRLLRTEFPKTCVDNPWWIIGWNLCART